MYFRPMLSIILVYLILLLLAFLLQRKMIYFPETYVLEQQPEITRTLDLHPWPSSKNYRGFISRRSIHNCQGTIVVFHGNAGSARGRNYYIDALQNLGYRVILAEYPGYGAKPGQPSEQALVEDAMTTTRLALKNFGEPLFLWGESLGGGVVSGIVQSGQFNIRGIALITPFDSLPNVAQYHYPFLLGKWLTLDQYDLAKNLHNFTGNIAIIMALKDQVIPNKFSLNLFNQLRNRKKLWTFSEAGHNTLPISPGLSWWSEVMLFLEQETARDVDSK